MNLKKEFEKSAKIDARLKMQIARLDDATNPDEPLFSLLVRANNAQPLAVEGVQLNDISGPIRTAHGVSLNGLKALVDEPRVVSVSGANKMRML